MLCGGGKERFCFSNDLRSNPAPDSVCHSARGVLHALLIVTQEPLVLFDVFVGELCVKSACVSARIQTAQLAID